MRIWSIAALYLCFVGCGFAETASGSDPRIVPAVAPAETEADPLKDILARLGQNAAKLVSCTSNIDYLVIQDPDLLDAHALRKGNMYYLKTDERSYIRINFETLRQDDFDEEKRPEVYLFDGVWLTKVDYALEQMDRYQQAPEDKPLDALTFLSHHFPLVGFSGGEQLQTEFDIRLGDSSTDDDPNMIRLHLDVRKESRYSKDYKAIDFWIDSTRYLPRRVRALSTQGDIYDIRFVDIRTNLKLEKEAFKIDIPAHFRKNVEFLKQEPETKGLK